MFPMRLKRGPNRNNEWRCCFCLHVRTATMLLGIWHLLLHVLALSVLALIMRNHHYRIEKDMDEDYINMDVENILPTPLSKVKNDDNPFYLPTTQDGRQIYPADMDMGALMTVCTLAITLLLVYGTVKGKPIHLLPFYCLQFFDFTITTLSATSYFFYLKSVHSFVNEHWHNLPYRRELLELSPQSLSFIVIFAFFLLMLWKAYTIRIVWRCYKYLSLRQQATRSTVHYILPIEGSERVPEPDYSSLLPDYEAACVSAMKQPPPPSYQAAMEAGLPAYPDAVHVVSFDNQNEEAPRYGFVIAQSISEPAVNEPSTSVTVEDNASTTGSAATTVPADELKDEACAIEKPDDNKEKVKDESPSVDKKE